MTNSSLSHKTAADTTAREGAAPTPDDRGRRTFFASGSVLGAFAMSSCCILPLVLFSLGVTGAWIGNFTALYPYKPYFLAVTAVFLAAGFYQVYRRDRVAACDDRACGTPRSARITKAALWISTALTLAALGFPYVAPFLLAS